MSVRGVMELKGEYIQTDQQEVRAEELEYQGNKVERVEPISDETCEFFSQIYNGYNDSDGKNCFHGGCCSGGRPF